MLGACRVPVFIDRLLLPGSEIRNTGAGGDVDRARVITGRGNYRKGRPSASLTDGRTRPS